MEVDTNFLVYMYVREDGSPYYVGKGRPGRPYSGKGKPCAVPPKERIVIYREGIDEETAFRLERELIAEYGRKDLGTGVLRNKSDGGEGPSGRIVSEEVRRRMSEAMKGERNPNYGKKLTEERRKRMTGRRPNPRDWYHPVHGEVLQKSVTEIVKMFPKKKFSITRLNYVANEKIIQARGWRLLKNKELEYKHGGSISRDWYHPIYGVVLKKSATDLVKMFPDQNLFACSLNRVANGENNKHRDWRRLDSKGVQFRRRSNIPRNWFHPDHGVVLQKSCAEMAREFPEQNLSSRKLSEVTRGKSSPHRGWGLFYGPHPLP